MARRLPSMHQVGRRLRALDDALAESWLHSEGHALVAQRLAALIPGTAGLVYMREPDGSLGPMGHGLNGRLDTEWATMPVRSSGQDIERSLAYPLRGRYPLDGRFVNTSTSYARDPVGLARYQRLLDDNGVRHHLRVAVYVEGRMRAWYGVFGDRGGPEFTAEEVELLNRTAAAVRAAVRAGHLTRHARAEPEALQAILESLDQPVWILTPRGFVVHMNRAARTLGREHRAAAARVATTREGDARFAVSRVSIGGDFLALVIGRFVAGDAVTLPPSLARIADRIAAGKSDKEIAQELDVPLATVRTYVRRIYARLRVHNRVELTTRWRPRAR